MIAILYFLAALMILTLVGLGLIIVGALTGAIKLETWDETASRLHCVPAGIVERRTHVIGKTIISKNEERYRCDDGLRYH